MRTTIESNLTGSSRELSYSSFEWNKFFSSLAFAENAAADVCLDIAWRFDSEGRTDDAFKYRDFFSEESRHFELVRAICDPLEKPTEAACQVYNGELFLSDGNLEKMAVVHLVFEPSALAFLGFIQANAIKMFPEKKEYTHRVREHFSSVLRDEVSHVSEGKKLVERELEKATGEDRRIVKRSIRRHRAFIKAGLTSFLKDKTSPRPTFVSDMLSRFDFYFNKSMKGVAL